jgi:subtilisin family serine protease
MSHTRNRSIAVAVILAAGMAVPAAQTVSARTSTGLAVPESGSGRSITLITGDQVFLDDAGHPKARPAKGREKVGFLTQKDIRGDVHVIPFDALGVLRSGQVDPRLFDVTDLVANGYGDDARSDIPLIISGVQARSVNAQVVRELPSVNATAVVTAKGSSFWNTRSAAATKIWLDGPMHATLDRSVPQIGAPAAWAAGYTGKNTRVAILDTGIDATHPDLVDAVADASDFTNSASGTTDKFGHGTHVASIVTGNNVPYMGVAPDTRLIIGKVLNDHGSGTESQVLAGMEWAANSGAQVINMSLGDDTPSDGTDLVSQAVNRLTAQTGALFVVAAGNNGRTPGTPAAADAALTVGAVDRSDTLAPFSSRGPRLHDNAIKPYITAPGVDIVAAKAKDSVLAGTQPNIGDTHLQMSGTSMATPHVAGAAAILAGEHPDWKAPQLKAALMNTARTNPSLTVFEQGAGRVDVAKAFTSTVQATPASISDGVAQWPHTDDKPINNTVTYHNSGTGPVTLNLAPDVKDPTGKAAPAGMFTVSPTVLTIAPGADAQATVVANTTVNGADSIYSGVITAGDIRTPITVTREPESHDIKLNFLGTDGNPTAGYAFRLVSTTKPEQYVPYDASGSLSIRVPKDHYYFESQISTSDGPLSVYIEPDVDMSGTKTLTVDPRKGKPSGVVLDRAGAKAGERSVEFARSTSWGGRDALDTTLQVGAFTDVIVSPSNTSAPGQFRYSAGGRFAEQDSTGSFDASPYLYNVRGDVDGHMPSDPVVRIHDKDLVKVRTTHGATKPGMYGSREGMITKALPFVLDELYSPETPWLNDFFESTTPDGSGRTATLFSSTPRSFPRARSATDSFNLAVFGPDVPSNPGRPFRYASRSGDTMIFQIPFFSDSGRDREGFSLHTGTATLYRDGIQTGTSNAPSGGLFNVPAGSGTFRLHSEASRDTPLSGRIIADWTFRSTTVTDQIPQSQPLMAVKFTPTVDERNQAYRVLPTIVPISVNHNTGATASLSGVEVSHDKGSTWRAAPVLCLNGKWYAVLTHPAAAKSVSLKASAQDAAGNSVTETIIDAFLLK